MARSGKKKTPGSSGGSVSVGANKLQGTNRVALEIKDLKFESAAGDGSSISTSNTTSNHSEESGESGFTIKVPSNSKLERILSELESGCLAEVGREETKNSLLTEDAIGYLRKKMAALGFQAGIQLSNGGAFRDARRLLDGFPGDDEYELTFEEVDSEGLTEEEEEAEEEGAVDEGEYSEAEDKKISVAKIKKHLIEAEDDFDLEDGEVGGLEVDLNFLSGEGEDVEDVLLNGSGLDRLDPLRILSNKLAKKASGEKGGASASAAAAVGGGGLNYPLIDPLKLQVIQSAESELTTVHDLFESNNLSSSQKLPLLKRKYMELMQQDIRHRLEALRVRDYLDTLHLERQVVERELEKAVNLRSSMEQLCERLQAENAKIRAEKAGITTKIYGELELKALEDELAAEGSSKSNPKKSGKKQADKKGASNNNNNNSNNSNNSNNNNNIININGNKSSASPSVINSNNVKSLPSNLPEAVRSVSFEVPDANKLLEGAQGDLRARFQLLIDLYNQREGHFLAVLKAKDAEIQLLQSHFFAHQAQIQKANQTNRELNGKLTDLSSSESDLRAQLSVYVDKFKQVEDTLSKSNDLFATFRHEMEQMTTKLGRLEKENSSLQSKCTTLSRNIIEMADERSKQAAAIDLLRNQKSKLESLCRTMQAERNAALQQQSQKN